MKIKNPLLTVLGIYGLCFVFRFVEYFIIRTDKSFLGEAVIHKLLGILVLYAFARLFLYTAKDIGFSKKKALKHTLYGLAFGLCVFALAYTVEIFIAISSGNFKTLQLYVSSYAVDGNIGNQTGIIFFIICILGNIINVVMEEGVFRGLFTKILEKKYTFIISAFIASALFGIWHFIGPLRNYTDGLSSIGGMWANIAMLVITSSLVGFKFALLTKLTGSLYMAIGDHFVNNTIVNIFHVVSTTGADELMFVRITIAQTISFILVLFYYLRRNHKQVLETKG